MKAGACRSKSDRIIEELKKKDLTPMPLYGVERTVIAVIGEERNLSVGHLEALPGVEKVMRVVQPYKLVSKETKKEKTIITVGKTEIGGSKIATMAGPCAIESEEQMEKIASCLCDMGVKIMRAGAYKPRTGPYSFQGLGAKGLKIFKKIADKYNLAVTTEVLDIRHLDETCQNSDILQIGARNMQNFELLKEVGKIKKPVLLKRGLSATIEELLLAAEYILSYGNHEVILCERGIRTFETETRNTLALATVPLVKELSHLPIIVDPSHGTGVKSIISSMSKAAIAAGADGLIIEVHPDPQNALSDAQQQFNLKEFDNMLKDNMKIIKAVNKKI